MRDRTLDQLWHIQDQRHLAATQDGGAGDAGDALEERPEDEETVYVLLCRKIKSDTPDRAEMKKATDALFRRGFSWDEIKCAVNRFWDEHGRD